MLSSLVIALREGLEAALIIGILLAYLSKTGQAKRQGGVWLGAGLALLASLVAAAVIFFTVGELEEVPEHIYAGLTTLAAVAMLSYAIAWMHRQARGMRAGLERQAAQATGDGSTWALAGLAFLVIVREGIETVLFVFAAARVSSPGEAALGTVAGLAMAAAAGFGLYRGGLRLNLGTFFAATAFLLTFFAAGMLAHGLRELIEVGLLPGLVAPVWDTSVQLAEQSPLGQVLKALAGYTATPSLLETLAYAGYIVVMVLLYRRVPTLAAKHN